MTLPTTILSDMERVSILDEFVNRKLNRDNGNIVFTDNGNRNTLVRRDQFSAVIQEASKPISMWDHLWCLILTLISFGLGLIVWLVVIWMKMDERRIRLNRYDVTPSGEITRSKISSN